MIIKAHLLNQSKIFHAAQQAAFNILTESNGGIVWHKAGEGKTRIGLVAGLCIANSCNCPILLFVGRRIAFLDIAIEIATLQIDCELIEIEKLSPNHKFRGATVLLMSWGMWKNTQIEGMVHHLIPKIGCMVIDEGWLYKNPQSITCETARKIGSQVPTILMSGSIMPAKDITDIYGQVAVIGRAKTLARTLSDFRSKYMMGIREQYISWFPKKGAYKQIISAIKPFTHIHFPPDIERKLHVAIKRVAPTPLQSKYFKELKDFATIEDKLEVNHAGAVIIKAQQISDGWLKRDDGEIEYFESNKVKAVVAQIEEIFNGGENRIVVWCSFREDLERLEDELAPHFCNVAIFKLRGGIIFDVEGWKHSTHKAIVLATMSSGTSFNLFGQVPYAIYFSQDWKWLSLDQSQRRHVRKDSEHTITHFTFLHTEESLDSKIHYIVKSAASTERTFIRQLDVAQWVNS